MCVYVYIYIHIYFTRMWNTRPLFWIFKLNLMGQNPAKYVSFGFHTYVYIYIHMYVYIYISIYVCIRICMIVSINWRSPIVWRFAMADPVKLMIWKYPHFRKPPYLPTFFSGCMICVENAIRLYIDVLLFIYSTD